MDEICASFDHLWASGHDEATDEERRDFEQHLAECPACREQRIADRAVEKLFSDIPRPQLSPAFGEELDRRLSRARGDRIGRPFLMQLYWLTASILSLLIFVYSGNQCTQNRTALLLALVCFTLPTLLLGRVFRFSLFDLIVRTMNHPEKRFGA